MNSFSHINLMLILFYSILHWFTSDSFIILDFKIKGVFSYFPSCHRDHTLWHNPKNRQDHQASNGHIFLLFEQQIDHIS